MVPCESTSEEVSFVCHVAPDALHFTIVTLLLLRLVYPSKVCIAIVPNFSWVLQSFQEKLSRMLI